MSGGSITKPIIDFVVLLCPPPVLRASARARARDDDDSFDPDFEVDTPQMNAWIEKVKAEEDEADQE